MTSILDEVIGQEHAKEYLKRSLEGLMIWKNPIKPFLITGKSGCGKSHLVESAAKVLGTRYREVPVTGSDMTPTKMIEFIQSFEYNDVINLDEFHNARKEVQEIFFEYIKNNRTFVFDEKGKIDRTTTVSVPSAIVFFTTNNPGALSEAFVNRCNSIELDDIDLAMMEQIIVKNASEMELELTNEAKDRIAKSAFGVPREAIKILENYRQLFGTADVINCEKLDKVFKLLRIDEKHLLRNNEKKYLKLLYTSPEGSAQFTYLKTLIGFDSAYVTKLEHKLMNIGLLAKSGGHRRYLTPEGVTVCDDIFGGRDDK
jgi:Holliday junction resolvasome RuvABC ATP-dependent DNA helicase subunit